MGNFSLRTLLRTFGITRNLGRVKTFVEPALFSGICCLVQWIRSPRKVNLDLKANRSVSGIPLSYPII